MQKGKRDSKDRFEPVALHLPLSRPLDLESPEKEKEEKESDRGVWIMDI